MQLLSKRLTVSGVYTFKGVMNAAMLTDRHMTKKKINTSYVRVQNHKFKHMAALPDMASGAYEDHVIRSKRLDVHSRPAGTIDALTCAKISEIVKHVDACPVVEAGETPADLSSLLYVLGRSLVLAL
eukprot:GHVP01048218.1.p1 GENE.GHVP01048218.1~~GHVP01048218.1.p1  ORF type:complete len:127 (+),score=12.87 GHVP01048218.1:301-681(+)